MHEGLDRDRVGFAKEVVEELVVGEVYSAGRLVLASEGVADHFYDHGRDEVRGYADYALGSAGHEGKGESVVSGEDHEVVAQLAEGFRNLGRAPARFLEGADMGIFLVQTGHRGGGYLNPAAGGYGVKYDGLFGALGQGAEVGHQSLLAWLVVVGGDEEESVGSSLVRFLGKMNGFLRGVGSGARNDRNATLDLINGLGYDLEVLAVGEGRGFSRRAAGNDPGDAGCQLAVEQVPEVRVGDGSVLHGRDESGMRSVK